MRTFDDIITNFRFVGFENSLIFFFRNNLKYLKKKKILAFKYLQIQIENMPVKDISVMGGVQELHNGS